MWKSKKKTSNMKKIFEKLIRLALLSFLFLWQNKLEDEEPILRIWVMTEQVAWVVEILYFNMFCVYLQMDVDSVVNLLKENSKFVRKLTFSMIKRNEAQKQNKLESKKLLEDSEEESSWHGPRIN